MDKLQMRTKDFSSSYSQKLTELIPACATEVQTEQGIKRVIDLDKLKQFLAEDVIDGPLERYQFTWPDKKKAIRQANSPSTMALRPCRQESVNFDDTKNLYIEGDNLDVLKLLREDYLGAVKVIYIDPPYNTGKDFVYADNFSLSKDVYENLSGQVDESKNRLVQNTDSNGRFHTDWLNMIYPRLIVSRDLLSRDGVLFVSIDDNEVDNLKKVCDEVFGASNFVGQLVLKTATDNNPSQINIEHEYMLCYAKNKVLQQNWVRQSEAASKIIEKYRELKTESTDLEVIKTKLRKWIKENKDDLPQVAHYNNVDEKGVYSSSTNSSNPHPGGYMFDILHPITGKACPKPQNGWRWPEKTFWAYDADGEIEWGKDEKTQPHVKKRIETAVEYLRTLIYEDNRATTKMLADLFDGHKVFDNPKPVTVMSKILDFVTEKNSLVLDFFSGSATTAHAVMKLNAGDGGSRQFIMVQLPEETSPSSEAYKCGYKNICEIGKERIRRAGKLIVEEFNLLDKNAKIDTGFRVLKLDSSNMKDVFYKPEDSSELTLFENNIKPERSSEDLLFQVMLECNLPLSAKIVTKKISGKDVFFVNNGYLIACFDSDIDEKVITEVAKMKPYYFILRDSSLSSDNVADNFDQIFQAYSKETIRRVL